jgi:aminomethyltransferase
MSELKKTPLYDLHVQLGGKIVPFAGYEMPVQYPTGITAEHNTVRKACGLFDVSHMGEFIVTGEEAVEFVNAVTTNNVAGLQVGQVHYSGILNESGTFEDDCLVYRSGDHLMMVVNASNKDKDFAHISKQIPRFKAQIEDASDKVALLALQGPAAQSVLSRHTTIDLENIGYYWFTRGTVGGVKNVIVSRTGYTGEDGFELYFDPRHAVELWKLLTAKGDVMPCGLGCRDSLRLEMGMALYGNDIDDTTTPWEANLGWLVKMKKGEFTGRQALHDQRERGVKRKLAAFTFADRAFPRHGYPVFANGQPSGEVRSGTISPSLGIGIGTAYVPVDHCKPGNTIEVDVRGKRVVGTIVETPFWKYGSHR